MREKVVRNDITKKKNSIAIDLAGVRYEIFAGRGGTYDTLGEKRYQFFDEIKTTQEKGELCECPVRLQLSRETALNIHYNEYFSPEKADLNGPANKAAFV